MVKLATLVMKQFPNSLEYTSAKEFTFHQITQRNWNTLLLYDARVDGMKTGHVDEAGFHLVATAHADNMRLVSALMGAPNAEKRRTETEKLLAWAFRSFVNVTPDWRPLVPASLPVYEGVDFIVALAPPGPVTITLPKGDEKKIKLTGGLDVNYLVAPVPMGTKVGSLTVHEDDRTLLSVPIETQRGIDRGGLFRIAWGKLELLLHRIGHAIKSAIRAAIGKIPFMDRVWPETSPEGKPYHPPRPQTARIIAAQIPPRTLQVVPGRCRRRALPASIYRKTEHRPGGRARNSTIGKRGA